MTIDERIDILFSEDDDSRLTQVANMISDSEKGSILCQNVFIAYERGEWSSAILSLKLFMAACYLAGYNEAQDEALSKLELK